VCTCDLFHILSSLSVVESTIARLHCGNQSCEHATACRSRLFIAAVEVQKRIESHEIWARAGLKEKASVT
jgi:hypothetical protein